MATMEALRPDLVPDKRDNLRDFWRTVWTARTDPLNRPLHLFLEVTSRCNLRCAKCGMNYDPARLKAQNLSFPMLSDLGDYFRTAVEVNTFGYGEMFLYKELRSLVGLLKSHDCRLAGITNGTRISDADVPWLVAERYDCLTFSIDGATPETMKRLRGADLKYILRVLRLIRDEKRRQGSPFPRIVVNFVAQKDNYTELPQLVRILSDLDVFFMGVNALHHFSGPTDSYKALYLEYRLNHVPRAEVERVVAESRQLAEAAWIMFRSYIDFDFEWPAPLATPSPVTVALPAQAVPPSAESAAAPALAEPEMVGPAALPAVLDASAARLASSPLPAYYCLYPWMSLYLAADRTTKVCCYMGAEENLGSFSSADDIESIWHGAPLNAVRDRIREGKVHPACRVCVEHRAYESYQPLLRDMIQHVGLNPDLVEEVTGLCRSRENVTPEGTGNGSSERDFDVFYEEWKRPRRQEPATESASPREGIQAQARSGLQSIEAQARGLLRPGAPLRRLAGRVLPRRIERWIRRRLRPSQAPTA